MKRLSLIDEIAFKEKLKEAWIIGDYSSSYSSSNDSRP